MEGRGQLSQREPARIAVRQGGVGQERRKRGKDWSLCDDQ
jgi:hypothetical protein